MENIQLVKAREILDSRGNPTVEVDVVLSNGVMGRAAVPSGASTGEHEALELRDKDMKRFLGRGVLGAVENVNKIIAEKIKGETPDFRKIDKLLLEIDGTKNKSRLGANAMLGVSMAVAKADANAKKMPLYRYLNAEARLIPVPMMNILNGGVHADNNVDIQEFMIMPVGFSTFRRALQAAAEVFHTLKALLKSQKLSTSVGDEGGFAPNLKENEEAVKLIVSAIEKAGYSPSKDIVLALDSASSSFYKEGKYYFEGQPRTSAYMTEFYRKLINTYPIVSIEDGLDENDWDGWKACTSTLGSKVQLVGDDLFVTNTERLSRGIENNIANSILIKVNQIGTLSETLDAIKLASANNYTSVISHRSGETEDTIISHLAVATECGQIKTGSVSRTDRIAKYNELLRIEEELGGKAQYAGEKIKSKFF